MSVNEQFMKPTGEEGREVIKTMNEHHRPVTEWALSKMPDLHPKRILDIGCGGGMLIGILADLYPDSVLDGVDISDESVSATIEYNLPLVEVGRLNVTEGSVSDLPYDPDTFDLITAIETYFFWPDLELDIFSASNRLVRGGTMMIASEAYVCPEFKERNDHYSKEYGVRLVSNEMLADMMESAGLTTTTYTFKENNWVVFVGKRR